MRPDRRHGRRVALGLRPRLLSRDNSFLPLAVGASVGLVLAGVYLPWLRDLLDTVPLAGVDAALAVGTGLVGCLAAKIRVYG